MLSPSSHYFNIFVCTVKYLHRFYLLPILFASISVLGVEHMTLNMSGNDCTTEPQPRILTFTVCLFGQYHFTKDRIPLTWTRASEPLLSFCQECSSGQMMFVSIRQYSLHFRAHSQTHGSLDTELRKTHAFILMTRAQIFFFFLKHKVNCFTYFLFVIITTNTSKLHRSVSSVIIHTCLHWEWIGHSSTFFSSLPTLPVRYAPSILSSPWKSLWPLFSLAASNLQSFLVGLHTFLIPKSQLLSFHFHFPNKPLPMILFLILQNCFVFSLLYLANS